MKTRNSTLTTFCMLLAACGQMKAAPEPATSTNARSDQIIGVASVVDGDTIEIHSKRIRLSGFDSPERGKRCGDTNVYQKAAIYLSDQIATKTVTCTTTGEDRYNRAIATCSVHSMDLGDIMVGAGWARDWPKYSRGQYADEERAARSGRRGVWGLTCPDDLWGDRDYQ